MKMLPTAFAGLTVIELFKSTDMRGHFVKTIDKSLLTNFNIAEEFYSVSYINTIRGMHFQVPPHAHQKLVYCSDGTILDVILDLRKSSPSYGKIFSLELSGDDNYMLLIPKGMAHGFMCLSQRCTVEYKVDKKYEPSHDCGIRWDSFGFEWPSPIPHKLIEPNNLKHHISQRDKEHPHFVKLENKNGHPKFINFETPFA